MTRIEAICTLVERCHTLADVGCDHGYVARYAATIGCDKVIAADISEISVEKARKTLCGFNGVKFVVSDGFAKITDEVDVAVITGMGGKKIAEILDGVGQNIPTLILGPQHDAAYLRRYLTARSYRIDADFMTEERGKTYSFLRARFGKTEPFDYVQEEYGVFYKKANPALKAFAEKKREKLLQYSPTKENLKRLAATEEVLKWQR